MHMTVRAPRAVAPVRVTVYGADTPRGRELASLIRLHPHVASAQEIARDGSPLVGRDGAAEPRWGDAPGEVEEADVVFVCLPPGEVGVVSRRAARSGARVIEVSSELREGVDPGADDVAYGLPELAIDELPEAERVATASSVATSAALALGPAALAGHLPPTVEVCSTVGVVGSHAVPSREAAEEEIQGAVSELHRCPREPRVSLEQQVEPSRRGVVTTIRLRGPGLTADRVQTLFATFYADAPCVLVVPEGLPTVPAVEGTNKAHIGIRAADDGAVEVTCVLDDALKGSVGQAIQAMNVVCGFPETLGLPEFALFPIPDRPALRPDV